VKANPVYALLLSWPENNEVELTLPKAGPDTKVTFLGFSDEDIKVYIYIKLYYLKKKMMSNAFFVSGRMKIRAHQPESGSHSRQDIK